MRSIIYINDKIKYVPICVLILIGIVACNDDDVNIGNVVTSMEIAGTEEGVVYLTEEDTWNVEVTIYPANATDATDYTYTYTSSNENVFTVSENGVVTAVGTGEAALTAWSVNNTDMWASCIISVEERIYPVTSIEIPETYLDYYMPREGTLNLGSLITVLPDNASNAEVIYSSSDSDIIEVNSRGEIYAKAVGDVTITVRSVDGSGVSATCNIHVREVAGYNDIERTGWTISASHEYSPDSVIGGQLENLIDDDLNSCLALVKPGKTLGDITVGADEEVYFIIDMQQSQVFDYFRLRHRVYLNTSSNLRVTQVAIYGSNDGESFDTIIEDQAISTSENEVTVVLPGVFNYRYFKLQITGWNSSGNTIQMSDFHIGKISYAD